MVLTWMLTTTKQIVTEYRMLCKKKIRVKKKTTVSCYYQTDNEIFKCVAVAASFCDSISGR